MANEWVLKALKAAMKSELDGIAAYEAAAVGAGPATAVRDFFLELAGEEKKHFNWLLAFYQEYADGNVPSTDPVPAGAGPAGPIVTEDFLKRVGSSRELSAAISTAILLESNGARHYRAGADATDHPALRSLFGKLADWEERHYRDLLRVQEESERFYWDAARWEPF